MQSSTLARALAGMLALALSASAAAQEVVLRIHHFLPPQATIQQKFFVPWCEKIGKESGGRLKCQIYPAMQLGGAPPQLFDQARDGVADIIWTIPTYQAGRFIKSEVFELPFMAKSAEAGSPALWEYIQKHSLDEFKGTKLIAAHLHDGALLHFANKRVTNMDEVKGEKMRSPTRISAKLLSAIGAAPVQMPVPQVPESVAKGVLDGAMVPWEIVPTIKLQEITKYHLDNAPGAPKMSNSIFVVAKAFDETTEPAKKLARDAGGVFDVLSPAEYDRWQKATEGVVKEWSGDVATKGANGQVLYDDAKALIKKYGG